MGSDEKKFIVISKKNFKSIFLHIFTILKQSSVHHAANINCIILMLIYTHNL